MTELSTKSDLNRKSIQHGLVQYFSLLSYFIIILILALHHRFIRKVNFDILNCL